ncbi:MAG: MFS transporter [Filifactoraceae bacterium]
MERNIQKVLIGRLMSAIGEGLFLIALPLYFYKITNSLFSLGVFFMIIKIPSMLLMPKIGLIVEKINKKYAMVVSDYIAALLFGALAICQYFQPNNLYLFSFFSIGYIIVGSFFSISSSVLFTQLTSDENRLKINSYKSILDNIVSLGTPAAGTLLFSLIGMQGILVINVIAFFISATIEIFIEYKHNKEEQESEKLTIKDYKEVYKLLVDKRNILKLLVIVMILNFFVAPNEEVIFVGILIGKYKISSFLYGISTTVFIIGSLVASFLVTKEAYTKMVIGLNNLFVSNSILLAFIGVASICLYGLSNWVVFYGVFFIIIFCIGLITTLINVPLITRFQTDIPVEVQGRFFATLSLGGSFLIPTGIFVAGFFSNIFGADYTLVAYNILVIIFVLLIKPDDKRQEEAKI